MEEVWRPVKGYEGRYEVSNLGNIDSLNYHRSGQRKSMSQQTDRRGYLRTLLWKDGKKKTVKVHRVVAEAFLPNPNNYPQVNNKDEDKTNNCADNLEWCDCKYNLNYGTYAEKRSRPVIATLSDGTEEYYPSINDAMRKLGHGASHIPRVIRQEYGFKSACGRNWRYAEVTVCSV